MSTRSNSRPRRTLRCLAAGLLLLGLAAGCASPRPLDHGLVRFRTYITTEIDDESLPTNDLQVVSMSEVPEIYVYADIFRLPPGRHGYRCELFDAADQLVEVDEMELEATGGTWTAWCHYAFNRSVDEPGTWRFDIYLEDLIAYRREFRVE